MSSRMPLIQSHPNGGLRHATGTLNDRAVQSTR